MLFILVFVFFLWRFFLPLLYFIYYLIVGSPA